MKPLPAWVLRWGLHAGWLAAVGFVLALTWLGGDQVAYRAALHPLGHLGALQTAGAWLLNLCGYVLPGVLLFGFVLALEVTLQRDAPSRMGRIATGILMLSALAFAAQGLLPFDLEDIDARASQHHVVALGWALIGAVAGACLLAISLIRQRPWRSLVIPGSLLALALLALLLWPAQDWLPALRGRPGHAQRLVFALYFAWFALASRVALRNLPRIRSNLWHRTGR